MRRWGVSTVVATLLVGVSAQTTLYTTSFENPPFVSGQSAVGRDGWAIGATSGNSQSITNQLARTGAQSLFWNNTSSFQSYYSVLRAFNWQNSDPDKLVVSVYLYIPSTNSIDRIYGVYLADTLSAGLGSTILGITLGGDGRLRAGTTWGATYSGDGFAQAPAGTYANRWLRLELSIDRSLGQGVVKASGFSDGAEYTATFAVSATPVAVHLGTDYVSSFNPTGVGYFDDLSIRAEAGAPFVGWDEQANGGGDAGDQIETAQSTNGDPIPRIRGRIDGDDDVDIYAIFIQDPQNFSASTIGGTTLDTALWLFDANGKGVLYNDDNPDSTSGLQSRLDNRGGQITQPGVYYLAVSLYPRRAGGCDDGLIWSPDTALLRQIRSPDGTEPNSRLASWVNGTGATGRYVIELSGVRGATTDDPADCPPPAPWVEQFHGGGDAGDLPTTAQIVSLPNQNACESPLTRIRGALQSDDVDMYVIYIQDPASFVASTVGNVDWDTQLWLFDCNGFGVVHNDDAVDTLAPQSRLDNSTNCISAPGVYLLAISRYGRDPVDTQGRLLWNDLPFRAVRCPDGPGAANAIAGWRGSTASAGNYIISLQGAYFVSSQGCAGTCPSQCAGDANHDGRVDDADLLIVLFNFGCTGFGCQGDVDPNGIVDDADLLIVLFNFGCGA